MSQAICNNHGTVEAVWKEGVAKGTGRAYAFWSCPTQEKDKFGNWIKCKVEVANTPSGKFDQSLDKAGAHMDASKKDELITRLAIAKSLIEAGRKVNEDAVLVFKEAERWLSWCKGENPLTGHLNDSAKPQEAEEVPLEDIPF